MVEIGKNALQQVWEGQFAPGIEVNTWSSLEMLEIELNTTYCSLWFSYVTFQAPFPCMYHLPIASIVRSVTLSLNSSFANCARIQISCIIRVQCVSTAWSRASKDIFTYENLVQLPNYINNIKTNQERRFELNRV